MKLKAASLGGGSRLFCGSAEQFFFTRLGTPGECLQTSAESGAVSQGMRAARNVFFNIGNHFRHADGEGVSREINFDGQLSGGEALHARHVSVELLGPRNCVEPEASHGDGAACFGAVFDVVEVGRRSPGVPRGFEKRNDGGSR